MKKGTDIFKSVGGLYVVHHNLPGKEVELHAHEEHVLFLPLLGDIKVLTMNKPVHCSPGRMLFLPTQIEHAFQSAKEQGERLIVLIKKSAFKTPMKTPGVFPSSQILKELLFEILLCEEAATLKLLEKVFLSLLESKLNKKEQVQVDIDWVSRAKDARLKKAVALLEENIDEAKSLELVSKKAGLSERTLHRLCVKELGVAPKQVLQQLRIEKAKELLRKPNVSVTSVSYDVGYQSLAQFIEIFRRQTGRLPSEFLKISK